ncbi:MAG: hypothetical protein OD918_02950 [Gammaproteobacteria bacterium]
MSRKITITSEALLDVEAAREVVAEMRAQGHSDLSYDEETKQFVNAQWDDVADDTVPEAVRCYGLKVQERMASQTEQRLQAQGYATSRKVQGDGKIKIIAKQRVYA